jgi:hypothetical protein
MAQDENRTGRFEFPLLSSVASVSKKKIEVPKLDQNIVRFRVETMRRRAPRYRLFSDPPAC